MLPRCLYSVLKVAAWKISKKRHKRSTPAPDSANYYAINLADTIGTSRIASWATTAGNNYPNNNGNPPYNNKPNSNTTATSAIVYKLNGNTGDKTGLGITLRVMSGDVVDVFGKSFYHLNVAQTPTNTYNITAALSAFINAFAGTSAIAGSAKGATGTALNASVPTTTGLNNWLGNVPNPGSIPKAYINWILFDEQFKPVAGGSGFDLVSATADAVKSHHGIVNISRNGYLYVYCSNESNIDVFFDNLQVIHTRGPLTEETHYYPFGLTMSGISSKAAGTLRNRYQFNGGNELQNQEFSDGSGLEAYDATNRMYDPQLGRFWQMDELAEAHWDMTPYNFAVNNPVRFNDPLGLEEGDPKKPKVLQEVVVRSYNHNQMQSLYWMLRDKGIGFDNIKNDNLRARLQRWDGIQRFMENVHAQTRESDKIVLEIGSWFIPAGQLTKLRYLKYAAQLFKLKRGIHVAAGAVDLTTQMIVNRGDITKVNFVATASSTLIGNPFLSSIPGAFANVSINGGVQFNSVSDPNVYKSILITTLGNVGGEKLGEGFKTGSTLPGGLFMGETLGAAGASVVDEMSHIGNKEEKK